MAAMIHESFDRLTEAVIDPEKVYGKREKQCDACVLTFSRKAEKDALKAFLCEKLAEIGCVNGNIPIHALVHGGRKVAFYRSPVSAAGAGCCLEEARCLTGASKYVLFGSCGSLDREIPAGMLIVPTEAYRDEGLSYHYAPARDYIAVRNAGRVSAFLRAAGIPYVCGRTWTTDAIFRETRGALERRRHEGCVAVEMECAGLQAVCDFRGLDFYPFLIAGDLLDAGEWERRILGREAEAERQLACMRIALEMAAWLQEPGGEGSGPGDGVPRER